MPENGNENAHHIRPNAGPGVLVEARPEAVGWQWLRFKVVALAAGAQYADYDAERETAIVPLNGSAACQAGEQRFRVARAGVFSGRPHVLYAPPRTRLLVEAETDFEFAIGSAPAEGKYPVRLFAPSEMKVELRGGGAAYRQVNHILAHPLPAERLILYEVYVPGGLWSSWPPHCHDGFMDSPRLEEVYYYKIEPDTGFMFHRNYRRDTPFDEVFTARDGDLVLVTQGFHPSTASPGCSVYFLNYLAGDLYDDSRGSPAVDDPDHAWIRKGWETTTLELPLRENEP
jgi:5-deoxy-glucuronate isomerase